MSDRCPRSQTTFVRHRLWRALVVQGNLSTDELCEMCFWQFVVFCLGFRREDSVFPKTRKRTFDSARRILLEFLEEPCAQWWLGLCFYALHKNTVLWFMCVALDDLCRLLVCASLSDQHIVESYCELVLPFRCFSYLGKARMVIFSFAMSLWVNLFIFVETKLNRVVSLCASEKSLVCGGIAVDHWLLLMRLFDCFCLSI